jgi:hypothetical protein
MHIHKTTAQAYHPPCTQRLHLNESLATWNVRDLGTNLSTVAPDGAGPAHATSVRRHHGSTGNQAGRHAGLPEHVGLTYYGVEFGAKHRADALLLTFGRRCGFFLIPGTPTVRHPCRCQRFVCDHNRGDGVVLSCSCQEHDITARATGCKVLFVGAEPPRAPRTSWCPCGKRCGRCTASSHLGVRDGHGHCRTTASMHKTVKLCFGSHVTV